MPAAAMLPVKTSPSKETRRRNGANGSDAGDIEYANPHHSNDSSPQKALLSHSHYPSDKPMVCSTLLLYTVCSSETIQPCKGCLKYRILHQAD